MMMIGDHIYCHIPARFNASFLFLVVTVSTLTTQPEIAPIDIDIPDNYVAYTLKNEKPRRPFSWKNWRNEISWISATLLISTPLIGIVGAFYTRLTWQTALFSILYYYVTGLGITAGYHRLWSHRSYNAGVPLQLAPALAGSGACQGSIKCWSRKHHAHHRYTGTELDPYSANKGFYHSHIRWMLVGPRRTTGVADISNLSKNPIDIITPITDSLWTTVTPLNGTSTISPNVQEQAQKRLLILVSGFMEEHPGGRHLLIKMIGKDATTAFVGGVHDHSNAAHNLLAMKRVGVLHGGHPHGLEEKLIPPSQSLKIARYNELSSSYASSSWSDSEGMIR
ncbi:hypothetical protein PLEOSDRAFT_1106344 [Pleurotus ostreatus PC15]|uniref:Cytochrome b5 heme-binding domain-containing protein n=1 Tax=Pleurotus ostreatus (strain PC15) TaxID=1137138 RepID=A0A067NEN4_PLEO1|nr:hypothetical protein PLEOSDRAFT_1106344 [Pleurotus ostreatus PC15]